MKRRSLVLLGVLSGCPSSPTGGDGTTDAAETDSAGESSEASGTTSTSTTTEGGDASSEGSSSESTGSDEPPPVPPPQGGEVCPPGGWCWIAPGPTGAHFYDVDSAGAGHTWAVGEGGLMMRLHEGSWTGSYPTDVDLHAVAAVSPGDVWAVGDDGVVLHFDGEAWTEAPSPSESADLRDIWIDPQTGMPWVVGDDVIAAWTGDAWDVLPKPVESDQLMHWTTITGTAQLGEGESAPPGRIGIVGIREEGKTSSASQIFTVWIDGDEVTTELAAFTVADEWPLDIGFDDAGQWWLLVQDRGTQSELYGWNEGWSYWTSSDSYDEPEAQAGFRRFGKTPEGALLVLGTRAWELTDGSPTLAELPLQPYLRAAALGDPGFHAITFNDAAEGWLVGGVGEMVELREGEPQLFNTDPVTVDGMSQLPGTDRMLAFGSEDGNVTIYEIDETPTAVHTAKGYGAFTSETSIGADGTWALPMNRIVGQGGAVLLRSPRGEFSQTADSPFVPSTVVPLGDGVVIVVTDNGSLEIWDGEGQSPACAMANAVDWVARRGEEIVFQRGPQGGTELRTWTPEGCDTSSIQPPESSLIFVGQMPTQAWFSTQSGDFVRLTAEGWTAFANPFDGSARVSASPEGWPWATSGRSIGTYDGTEWTIEDAPPLSEVDLYASRAFFGRGLATSASGVRYVHDRHRIIAEE